MNRQRNFYIIKVIRLITDVAPTETARLSILSKKKSRVDVTRAQELNIIVKLIRKVRNSSMGLVQRFEITFSFPLLGAKLVTSEVGLVGRA